MWSMLLGGVQIRREKVNVRFERVLMLGSTAGMVLLDEATVSAMEWPPMGAWMNKSMLAKPPCLERQVVMYRRDLQISQSLCVVCRQSRHLWEEDEPEDEDDDDESQATKDEDWMSDEEQSKPMPASFQLGRSVAAVYGFMLGKPTRCREHKLPDMENVRSPRCEVDGCARFLHSADPRCFRHGGGVCATLGCTKARQGGTMHCRGCGGGYRCQGCGQVSVASRGLVCWGCRTGRPRQKRFEMMVEAFLQEDERLRYYSYRDESVECSPNRRRPDFAWVLPTHVVVLEVDEYCHRHYTRSEEIQRMCELSDQMQGMRLIIIRFNPLHRHLWHLRNELIQAFRLDPPNQLVDVRFIGYPEESVYDFDTELEILRQGS